MKPKTLVQNLLREHETSNPFTLCRYMGIGVLEQYLLDSRGFYIRENGVGVIILAKGLPSHEQKFVCAHELGHALLHDNLQRVFMDSRTFMVADKYENEADCFAAQLLYAAPPLYSDESLTSVEMSECLNVPIMSVNARLLELGVYY